MCEGWKISPKNQFSQKLKRKTDFFLQRHGCILGSESFLCRFIFMALHKSWWFLLLNFHKIIGTIIIWHEFDLCSHDLIWQNAFHTNMILIKLICATFILYYWKSASDDNLFHLSTQQHVNHNVHSINVIQKK